LSPYLRVRLTAIYGAIFVVFVAALLGISYWLMSGHLQRTLPADDADAALAQLGMQYGLALLGATLIAVALGWALAGRELRSTAAAFQARERFVANASHELRSPLTVIRTEADVALSDPDATVEDLRAMGREVLTAADELDALLDALMELARSGQRLPRREPVDLAAAARAAAHRVRSPDGGGLQLQPRAPPPTACAPRTCACGWSCSPPPSGASAGCSSGWPGT
jgi:signal transduction histidine kinase